MTIFAEMMNLNPDDYIRKAEDLLKDKNWGEAKIELEKALELLPRDAADRIEETWGKIELCCSNLARMHEEFGDAAAEGGDNERAVEEFEFALSLLSDETAYFKAIRKKLHEAKRHYYKSSSADAAGPFAERGAAFFTERQFDSALVEFREALRLLRFYPDGEEPKKTVLARLAMVEEELTAPYLERGRGLVETGLFDEALAEFEAARAVAQTNEKLAQVLDRAILDAMRRRGGDARQEDVEVFISREDWDGALGDYQKLLDNYFRYSQDGEDPYQAIHVNPYEKELQKAKHLVGTLYIRRADGYLNLGKVAVALKYYAEAQNFFDEGFPEAAYVADRVQECKRRL